MTLRYVDLVMRVDGSIKQRMCRECAAVAPQPRR